MILIFLDVHDPKTRFMDGLKAVDWYGSFSILAATLMLLLGLDFGGETFPWSSSKVICLIIFGSLTVFIFVVSEVRLARYPLIPMHIFKHRTNIATLMVSLCQGIVSAPLIYLSDFFSNFG